MSKRVKFQWKEVCKLCNVQQPVIEKNDYSSTSLLFTESELHIRFLLPSDFSYRKEFYEKKLMNNQGQSSLPHRS